MEKIYTKADLAARWGVSRQVVNNWSKSKAERGYAGRNPVQFPEPFQSVSNGAIPLYLESDIKKYENERNLIPND